MKKVIILSGKYKSGKNYIGTKLAENLPALLLHINESVKLEYEKTHAEDCKDIMKYVNYFCLKKNKLLF